MMKVVTRHPITAAEKEGVRRGNDAFASARSFALLAAAAENNSITNATTRSLIIDIS